MRKESIFEFLKECDENLYQEIINEVEPNMVNRRCLPIIQSEVEKILKMVLKKSGIVLSQDRVTLGDLLNHNQFKQYLIRHGLMSEEDIRVFWGINRVANEIKHGTQNIEVNDELKINSLWILLNLCAGYCIFVNKKIPNAELTIEIISEYIDWLLQGMPQNNNKSDSPHTVVGLGYQEIVNASERLEAKLHNDSGYSVRQILFEMGIEINPDNEKTMRRKLRKLMDKKIYPDISGAGNEDIVYTPGGKGSGTYRLSKYRGK